MSYPYVTTGPTRENKTLYAASAVATSSVTQSPPAKSKSKATGKSPETYASSSQDTTIDNQSVSSTRHPLDTASGRAATSSSSIRNENVVNLSVASPSSTTESESSEEYTPRESHSLVWIN